MKNNKAFDPKAYEAEVAATSEAAVAMAGGNANVPATPGSIGQMGAIWFGGGTLVVVAGICGVPVLELVRKNLVPVLVGLFVTIVPAILFMM